MIDLRNYEILLPNDADACLTYASNELKDFIYKCTNLQLGIVNQVTKKKVICLSKPQEDIGVNNSVYDGLGDDGFIIREKNGNVYIDGNTSRSILYGVYDFVEIYLGVRFISADYTYIPTSDGIIKDEVSRTEVPAFPLRAYPLMSMFGRTVDPDFMARQRNYNNFTPLPEKYGYEPLIYARVQGTHNSNFFIPQEVASRHPEFFAFDDDKNHSADEKGFFHNSMICLTNGITDDGRLDESMEESVAKCVINGMIEDFVANPKAKYFVFDQMDGGVRCKCPKCMEAERKYMRSGLLMRFCNVVAKSVQEYSDKYLGGRKFYLTTLAYAYAKVAPFKLDVDGNKVPIDNSVIPSENVVIRLAVGFNSIYPMDDVRQRRDCAETLGDWSRLTKKMFYWGYDCGFDNFQRYFPSSRNISANVKYLAERKNVEYIFMDGCKNSEDWQCAMRSYAYCKLFWNPSLDADALIDEFNLHYFGQTAFPFVKEFMRIFDEHYTYKASVYNTYFSMLKNYKFPQNTDLSVIEKAQELIETAFLELEKAEPNGELKELHKKHLTQVYVMPLFYKLVDYKYYFPDMSREEYLQKAKEWVALCEKAGITMYHDSLSVKSFVDAEYVFPY